MSKLARKPIKIPSGVEVKFESQSAPPVLSFKGPKGSVVVKMLPHIETEIKDGEIHLKLVNSSKQGRSNWGTTAAHIRNAVTGVTTGFTKNLEFEGVGFRAELMGANLKLTVGFSHPVIYETPEGAKITVEKSVITVAGVEKELVGRVAAEIRKIRKPEPYKGTGIRYQGEVIRRKAGKKAATTAA